MFGDKIHFPKLTLAAIVLISAGAAIGIAVYLSPVIGCYPVVQTTVKPAITPESNSIDPSVFSSMIDLNKITSSAPADWGKIVKISNYSVGNSETGSESEIPNIYVVDFANNTKGYYQKGLDLIAYRSIKDQGECVGLAKKFGVNEEEDIFHFGTPEICYITDEGIYDLNAKKLLPSSIGTDFRFSSDIYLSSFESIDHENNKSTGFFSPQGKYFSQTGGYEGCLRTFLDVATGQYIVGAQSCDALVNFSKDEKTFTTRGTFFGMASPAQHFNVIQTGKEWEILRKLLPEEMYPVAEHIEQWDEVDPVKDFEVTSVTDTKIEFDIIKETQYYKKGSYIFTLSTGEVKQR